jgi:putative ABC transport system permease protein
MWTLLRLFSLRQLFSKPIRTLLTLFGVGLGIALFTAIELINTATLKSFSESVESMTGKAKLTITAGEAGFELSQLVLIESVTGVKSAVPSIEAKAFFLDTVNNTTKPLIIFGVDLLQETAVRSYKTTSQEIIDDPLVFMNQPDSIIVTHAFARSQSLEVDSKLNLITTQGKKTFTVRGLLSPEGPAQAFGGGLAVMDIDAARYMFGKEGKVDRVDVVPQEGVKTPELKKLIQSALGPSFHVDTPDDQTEQLQTMVQSYQGVLTFTSVLALFVGLFLVSNSVAISVAERRREIGTLRVLGEPRGRVWSMIFVESMLLGVFGALIGIGLGRTLAGLLVGMVTDAMSNQYMTPIQAAELSVHWIHVAKGLAAGVLCSVTAGLMPAFRATEIQPIEALRPQVSLSEFRIAPWTLALRLFGVFLLGLIFADFKLGWSDRLEIMAVLNPFFVIAGSVLAGPGIVTLLLMAIRRIARGSVLRLACDNLLRNPRRTGSNVMSLMVGLMLVIVLATLNGSIKFSLFTWFDRILRDDLLVSSQGKIMTFQVSPLKEELGVELAKIEGVDSGGRSTPPGMRYVKQEYAGRQLAIKAFDPGHPKTHYSRFDVKDRPIKDAVDEFFTETSPVAMVSENFVVHFKKKTGDTIELDTPRGRINVRIIAVVKEFANPEGVFYIPRETYKKFWNDSLVTGYLVMVKPGEDLELVRSRIDATLGMKYGVVTTSNQELRPLTEKLLDESFAYTRAIEFAALLVGLLGLLNTLMVSVIERTRELGMLRAVGMSRAQLERMIFYESLLQGTMGAWVATGIGAYVSYFWVIGRISEILGWILDFSFPLQAVLSALIAGIIVGLLAGWIPSQRASRLEIVDAISSD